MIVAVQVMNDSDDTERKMVKVVTSHVYKI